MVAVEVEQAINNHKRLPEEAKRILHGLTSSWSEVADAKSLEVVQMKGSMTNEVYQIKWLNEEVRMPSRKVLVRIYGEGAKIFFNRDDEMRTFECMSKHDLGPHLLDRFPNGRVEEFINAKTLSSHDLRNPEISASIAARLREFHDTNMPGSKDIILWVRLRDWLRAAFELCSSGEANEFCLANMMEEIICLQNNLFKDSHKVGFCHNDLQYGNIMLDEETKSVTLIDYDYTGYNPIAYDIANHFCEMAADYHTDTPHILDFNKYPDLEEQRRFLEAYLVSSGDKHNDTNIDILIQQIDKYTLASHLTWGLWGLISAHVNNIDFDYMGYARQRFQQYWLKKPMILQKQA